MRCNCPRLPALLLLAACAGPLPAPPAPPALRLHGERFYGAALALRSAFLHPGAVADDRPLDLQIDVFALPEMPPGIAIAAHATAITNAQRATPLRGHPATLRQARLRTDGDALAQMAANAVASVHAAARLPTATTTVLAVQERTHDADLGAHLLLHVDRTGIAALALSSIDGDEQVVLTQAPGPDTPMVVLLPIDVGGCRALAIALHTGVDADTPALTIAEHHDLDATLAASRSRLAAPDTRALSLRAQTRAFVDLVGAHHRRPALLSLCLRVGAARAADLALVADDRVLVALAQQIGSSGVDPSRSDQELAWQLERTAFAVLLPDLQRDTLAPELAAFLVRHAGATGRSAVELEQVLAAAPDVAGFDQGLRASNRQALHDADPAVRVRALDWLQARGDAVAGFDPFADRATRRAALQALAAKEHPATEAGR